MTIGAISRTLASRDCRQPPDDPKNNTGVAGCLAAWWTRGQTVAFVGWISHLRRSCGTACTTFPGRGGVYFQQHNYFPLH